MIDPRRSFPSLAALVLVLAACGSAGGGASAAPADSADAAAQPPAAAAGQSEAAPAAPASTEPSEPAPAPEAPAGGSGNVAVDVCALVTEGELGGILGEPVQTIVFAGPPDTCDIQSTDNAPLAAFVLTTMGGVAAATVYEAFAADPGSTDIGAIGEKAAYNPTQATLVILKNGSVLTVAVFDDRTADEAARLELMKQIGSIAAGRM
jgi:hypothetical protein